MGERKQGTLSFLTTGFPDLIHATWVNAYVCVCMHVYICLGICMCTHMHISVHVYIHICLYVCVHICACLSYVHIFTYVYTCLHAYMCISICMCTCVYTCLCVYMCMFCFRETCQVQSVCLQGHRGHFRSCQNLTVADLSNTRPNPAGIQRTCRSLPTCLFTALQWGLFILMAIS